MTLQDDDISRDNGPLRGLRIKKQRPDITPIISLHLKIHTQVCVGSVKTASVSVKDNGAAAGSERAQREVGGRETEVGNTPTLHLQEETVIFKD